MRRKRFQRGSLSPRKRNGKNYWYAQWREDGKPKSKEIGLCSKMTRIVAEGILTEILQPVNEGAENPEKIIWTFAKFCEVVYLPVCHQKWKASTGMVETNRLEVHLIRPLKERVMQEITRKELQNLLDKEARSCGRSMVDHLRFRLRSVFTLAMSEGVVDRNPAVALFTPRHYQEGRSRRVLTSEEAVAMIGALDLRERVIARLATWEGMRPERSWRCKWATWMRTRSGFGGGFTKAISTNRRQRDQPGGLHSQSVRWRCSMSGSSGYWVRRRRHGCSARRKERR